MTAWPALIGFVLRILAMLGIYAKGRGDEEVETEIKTLREENETLGRMVDAPQSDSPDAALVWLRKRKPTGNLHRNRK